MTLPMLGGGPQMLAHRHRSSAMYSVPPGAPIFRLAQFISLLGVFLAMGTLLIDKVAWGPPSVTPPRPFEC